jgi:hypothetical protein
MADASRQAVQSPVEGGVNGRWWWWYVLVGDGRYESHAAAAMVEELEVGETGESDGWVASRVALQSEIRFLEGCESEAVRGEARRDEIR